MNKKLTNEEIKNIKKMNETVAKIILFLIDILTLGINRFARKSDFKSKMKNK